MRKKWKKGVLCALFLGGLGGVIVTSCSGKDQIPEENIHMEMEAQEAEILRSCVRVQTNGHYGSGSIFALDEDKITIVTNRHVLQYWDDDSYVTFFNGASGSGWMVDCPGQADVGVLCVYTAGLSAEELNGLSKVEVSDSEPERGDWFFMADVASDVWEPVFYQGQILEPLVYLEDFGMQMLYGDSAFRAGMSGCGVFNAEGKYIGMLTGGTDQNEVAAVPVEVVIESVPLG